MTKDSKAKKALKLNVTNEGSGKQNGSRHKRARSVSKLLTYPGEDQVSQGQPPKKVKQTEKHTGKDKTDKASNLPQTSVVVKSVPPLFSVSSFVHCLELKNFSFFYL